MPVRDLHDQVRVPGVVLVHVGLHVHEEHAPRRRVEGLESPAGLAEATQVPDRELPAVQRPEQRVAVDAHLGPAPAEVDGVDESARGRAHPEQEAPGEGGGEEKAELGEVVEQVFWGLVGYMGVYRGYVGVS